MIKWIDKFPGRLFEYDQVHIWRAPLDYSESKVNLLIKYLSKEEIERANRFYFEIDRMQFIIRRGILRQIISKYLEIDPRNLQFECNRFGKPFLITDSPKHDLKFNMSHTKNMAIYCIATQKDVGIDIEYILRDINIQPIIDRFFSQNERMFIQKTAIDKRKETFYKIWTRKEAILKVLGKGISYPLEMIDVPYEKNNFTFSVNGSGNQGYEASFYVQDFLPAINYKASIAIEGSYSGVTLSYFTF